MINLSYWEVLSDSSSYSLEFFWTKSSIFVKIKVLEKLPDWSLAVSISRESKDLKECREVHFLRMWWWLNNINDLLGLVLNTEGLDGGDQFFSRDVSTSIVIEDIEAFLKLDNSLFFKVLSDELLWIKSLNKIDGYLWHFRYFGIKKII